MGLDPLTAMQKAVVQKAELVVSDLTQGSGALPVEQFREFVVIASKGSVLFKLVRLQEMQNPSYELPKIQAQGQTLHGASSGVALTEAQRAKPNILPKVVLNSKLLRGAVPVPDEVLEDNVEREALNNKIRDLTAQSVTGDWENLLILGDTNSPNDLLNVTDGIFKRISTNQVQAGGQFLNKSVLRDTTLLLPDEFREDEANMSFFTSHKAGVWYRDSVSNRTGDLGDDALTVGDSNPQRRYAFYNGCPVRPIPRFPSNLGVAANESPLVYANPKKIIFGIQRDLRIEYQRDPASGSNIFHVSCRVDVAIEHESMCVFTKGIRSS
jgi:hypothetical protein